MHRKNRNFFTTLTIFFWFFTANWVLQAQAASFAYIANSGDNSISIIDTTSNTVTATVPSTYAPYGVAVNPTGTRVYLTNPEDDSVSVLDTSTNTIVATIPYVGNHPHCIAINPAGTKAYAAADLNNTISVIDTATNTVVDTISSAGNGLFSLVVNSTGSKIYATNMNDGTVSVIDTTTKAVSSILIQTATTFFGIAINPDGTRVYAANYSLGTLSVIDTASDTVIHTVSGILNARGVSVNPDGTRVYVTSFKDPGTVSVINTSDNTVVATVQVGYLPISVSLNPEGTRAFVVNYGGDVSVIDTANNTVIATVPVGASPASQGQFVGPNMCTPAPSDMTSWWGGDNNALDMVGTNHGTLVNSATYTAGKINQAFSLDGGDDYVNIPHDASLSIPPSSPMSFELWVYRTSTSTTQHIFSKRNACDWFNYQLAFVEDTGLYFGWNTFQINSTGGAADLPLNTWTHIAGTSDGTTLKLFINGQLAASGAGTLGPENDDPLKLGAAGTCGTGPFGGLIDEMTIYHRPLSAEEIAASYNAGSAGKCRSCTPASANMVAWWKAENNVADSISTLEGTMENGATFTAGKIGQAFNLDGVNDYVDLTDGFADFSTGFTVGLWANPSASGNWTRFLELGNGYQANNILFLRRLTTNQLAFQVYNGTTLTGTAYAENAITNDEWHYYAATMDTDGNVQLYKDGTPLVMAVDSSAVAVPQNVQRTTNYIGKSSWPTPPDAYYTGKIDEVVIFNRALSADEIAALYNADDAGQCDIDTTPDDFTFTDQMGVNVSTVITSNPITVNGINYAVDVSIAFCPNSSCEYQINSGAWTSVAGKVNNGDTVTVRQTSSNGYSTGTDLALAIGSKSDTFSVSTMEPPQYSVTPSQTGSGTIDPSTPQTVTHGGYTTFTVTPDTNHSVAMGGTCGGTLTGATYATDSITADCTVTATFTLNTYTVTPSKTGNGTISPATPQTVNHGSTSSFTVSPDGGYSVAMGGTCGGSLVGDTYTTNAITSDCTVTATFTLNTYTVTPSKTGNGTISPSTPQTITHGSAATFTVTPDTGYSAAMGGTCGGALVGTTYTTNAITANCTVTASFTLNSYTLTLNKTGAGSGTVTSTPAGIHCGVACSTDYDFGTNVTLTAVPAKGSVFKGWTGDDCTGTGDCTVTMDEQKEISAAFEKDFPWPIFLPVITKGKE